MPKEIWRGTAWGREYQLVLLELSQLFPELYAKDPFALLEKWEVLTKAHECNCMVVLEQDILAYANATRQDEAHWKHGEGRRFLMRPIVEEEGGEVVSYRGPYPGTDDYMYELGLWREEVDPAEEKFPVLRRHPVQLKYCVLSSLVAKKFL